MRFRIKVNSRQTYTHPDIVPFLSRCGKLHIPKRSRHHHTVLMQPRRHRVRVKHLSHASNIRYTQNQSELLPKENYFKCLLLLAFDSAVFDDPGSAELQYNVFVYG